MAQVKLGYLIWDSRQGLNCNPTIPRAFTISDNFRPASLVPKTFGCGSDVTWQLYDGIETSLTTWGSYATGQRNGIAVTTEDGVVELWDIYGGASSDESTVNSPHAKLETYAAFTGGGATASVLGVQAFYPDDENSTHVRGQYSGYAGQGFPALATAATYCYSFTRSDSGDAQSVSLVELFYANYITGKVVVYDRNDGTGVTTYKICFDRPSAQIGKATGDASFTLL